MNVMKENSSSSSKNLMETWNLSETTKLIQKKSIFNHSPHLKNLSSNALSISKNSGVY